MASELERRAAALGDLLRGAAADGFAGVGAPGLGAKLAKACERVLAKAPEEQAAALASFAELVARYERLEEDEQMAVVARGLRQVRLLGGGARPAAAKPRSDDPLEQPTQSLPGIGPALAERLAERGLETVEDLVWVVPRRYDDARRVRSVAELLEAAPAGEWATVGGVSRKVRFVRRGRRGWIDVRVGDEHDDGDVDGALAVRWFNAHPGMSRRFEAGTRLVLAGRVTVRGGAVEMANPDVLLAAAPGDDASPPAGILPRYPDVPGVAPARLRKAIHAAVDRASGLLPDVVPPDLAARRELASLAESVRALHAPPADLPVETVAALDEGRSPWHRRLAYEELLVLGVAIARRRAACRADRGPACPEVDLAPVRAALPFALTSAQEEATAMLGRDLARPVPMNRLLQGDVGSGKTAVAFAAAFQVARAGRQVALMAPTSILAEQHFATLEGWCEAVGLRCVLLTAATPRPVRASLLSLLDAGAIDLVVGTHALLAEGVSFPALGLAIVDEQHRFGVAQRVRLRDKAREESPHLLVMTATPIPRTLALTAYGDLDVSVLGELPPGREPARTQVLEGPRGREATYRALARRLEAGERAFVVCPLVEPPEEDGGRDWADATSVAAELAERLAPHPVGLVHGRMPGDQRDAAMDAFRRGELSVLVATTVIEVGVDVPEATVIVIEDADHFGLAQLHQLRGRVGRGGGPSECVLLTGGPSTDEGARRLEVMVETTDGFRIAEEDLLLRGPGELLGARQAGLPRLRFGDLREHGELLVAARSDADDLVGADPELAAPEHAALRSLLERRMAEVEAYGAEGG